MTDKSPLIARANRTEKEAAKGLGCSPSFLKKARSHNLYRAIYLGDRVFMPPDEFERIAREGLPNVPAGYKRKTTGPAKDARPSKAAPLQAKERRAKANQGERAAP